MRCKEINVIKNGELLFVSSTRSFEKKGVFVGLNANRFVKSFQVKELKSEENGKEYVVQMMEIPFGVTGTPSQLSTVTDILSFREQADADFCVGKIEKVVSRPLWNKAKRFYQIAFFMVIAFMVLVMVDVVVQSRVQTEQQHVKASAPDVATQQALAASQAYLQEIRRMKESTPVQQQDPVQQYPEAISMPAPGAIEPSMSPADTVTNALNGQ